jgi:hypothetical protein
MTSDDRPFSTIESAQEFLALLADAIDEALEAAQTERRTSIDEHLERRAEAWQLVAYSLTKLQSNVKSSRRLMNDLRTLRNLLERTSEGALPRPGSSRAETPAQPTRPAGADE